MGEVSKAVRMSSKRKYRAMADKMRAMGKSLKEEKGKRAMVYLQTR